MMGDLRGHKVWKEPRVGHLFGEFYVNTPKEKTLSANFIMGEPTRDGWISAIRNFVLTGARHTFPFLGPENYLVVKEPGWCGGAVPDGGSAREPHDPPGARPPRRGGVFPGRNEEGELAGWGGGSGGRSLSDERPEAVARRSAKKYLRNLENARRAFDAHAGPKAVVLYEG